MIGAWTDVFVLPDGSLGQVAVDGAAVSCEVEGIPTWTQRASEALLFCRCAVHQGLVLTIHQGHDSGRAWLIGAGLVRDLGPTFGVQPVAIDRQFAYVVRSGYTYDQIDLTTGETLSHASPVPGSSQGISDVNPTDGLWWADLHRSLVVGGVTFTYPNVRGPVTVGQADPPRIAAALHGGVSTVFVGDGYEPHVVVSGTRAAVCARTPHSAAYAVLSTIQKVPGPIVNEKEPVMPSAPNPLPTIKAVFAAHPNINAGADEERGALTSLVVQALGGFPWGRKRKTRDGHELSDDALCYRLADGRFEIYDIMAGRNPGDPRVPNAELARFDYKGTFADGENGFFQSVVLPGPVPVPPPVVKPPVDLGPLEARIAALEAGLKKATGDTLRLAETVDAIKARPVPVPPSYRVVGSTSRTFSHSHAIDVRLEPIL